MDESLNAKLAIIQRDLKAPKGQYNNFGKYSYRNAEDILEAVKPLLGNLTLTLPEEINLVGNRFYIKATARLSDGKDSIEVSSYAREPESRKGMDEAQVTGASSSYARKYALNALFAIDDTKDPDTTNKHDSQASSKPTEGNGNRNGGYKPSDKQIKFLGTLLGKALKDGSLGTEQRLWLSEIDEGLSTNGLSGKEVSAAIEKLVPKYGPGK
jgi:hypothetical protein